MAERVRQVGAAWREHDDPAARAELRALADEVRRLAAQDAVWPADTIVETRLS